MKAIFKNTWAVLTSKERKQFGTLMLLDIIISIVDILSLALLLWIIQFYIQGQSKLNTSFLPDWITNRKGLGFIGLFFLLFGLKNLAAYFVARAHYRFIGKVAIRISANNLSNYQHADFAEFIHTDSSVQVRKIGFQPFEFSQYILSGIQQITTQAILIVLAIVAIILFNAKLFLLLLIILLPPVVVIFYFIRNRLNVARKNIRSSNEHSFQYLLDALKGWVESNIYRRNDFFMRRFISSRKKFGAALFESISIQNLPPRIIEIFAVLGLFVLIAIANWSKNSDHSMLLTIGAFMAAAYKIIPGIVKIINVSGQMRAYEFSISDLTANEKEMADTDGQSSPPSEINSLQLRNIHFQYEGKAVLNNFSLLVKKGDFLGISGQSGKGKTTVLNILLGFLKPAGGDVIINEKTVARHEIKNYWPSIAYVRQQPFFIYDTIARNITLEEDKHNKEALEKALSASGLNDFIAGFPEGMDKIITENGKNISGGQQQRICIARALYKTADVILLDEPFNELDEASVTRLLEHFRELSSNGKTIIMITHDRKSLSYCNKIISLDEQG